MEEFRSEVRAWLEDNCPLEMRSPAGEDGVCWGGRNWVFQSDAQRVWLDRMAARGWTVPTWPKEYGGAALTREEEKILREEMARINARLPVQGFGINMLGPALLRFGSEAQKQRHLPPIARGEIRWCQGYSEPGSGSDLASVRTRGERGADGYVVNGQKIWTSYADKADWIFCLLRTDPDVPKHKGLSFLLFDMDTPGVTTRPITLISGQSPFCETFFDDVLVPLDGLVGEEGAGWSVAKYLLTHERESIGSGARGLMGTRGLGQRALGWRGADASGRLASPMLRADIARSEVDAWAFELTVERVKDEAEAGIGVGAKSAMLKYYGTELNKRRYELMMSAAGADAFSSDSPDGGIAAEWLRSKANSIEGGTSEIMLNIIAKNILNLPGA